jgi:cobalt-zinc-cadmium efflux system membrane fusion protein
MISLTECVPTVRRVRLPGVIAAVLVALPGCGARQAATTPAPSATANQSVDLAPGQLRFVTVGPAAERTFTIDREAVGIVDYDQDRAVQVSPPYAGRVAELHAKAGDRVHRGQVLFTIESPDLVQAESTLIAAAATRDLDDKAAARAQGLYTVQGIAQKDYEQALSDQKSAQGAYEAARRALRIFGLGEAEIDQIVARRAVATQMSVPSPIDGVVTARSAAPGTLVQPGSTPAPYAVADVSVKWLLAAVPEEDLPALRLGAPVDVRVAALDRTFHGRIAYIAEALDPDTRRVTVRSELPDPSNELHPQMFATFTLHLGHATRSVAVPYDAVVREGDGTLSVWVTSDQRHFVRRTVRLGEQQAGYDQILDGLRAGELVAASGAVYVSNASVIGAAQD